MKKIPQTYEECDEDEKFIVDKLRNFNSPNELKKTNKKILSAMYRKYNFLLHIAFPNSVYRDKKDIIEKLYDLAKKGEPRPKHKKHPLARYLISYLKTDKEFSIKIRQIAPKWFEDLVKNRKDKIIEIANSGNNRPHYKEKEIGKYFVQYIQKTASSYDEEFDKKIRELRPDWFEDIAEKNKRLSFEKMQKLMPLNIKFKENQIYKGVEKKHIFICSKHGDFLSTPKSLMKNSWKKGKSGHPFEKYETSQEAQEKRAEILTYSLFYMLSNMPKDVFFLENQVWDGNKGQYYFKDANGVFSKNVYDLINYHWANGKTGNQGNNNKKGK